MLSVDPLPILEDPRAETDEIMGHAGADCQRFRSGSPAPKRSPFPGLAAIRRHFSGISRQAVLAGPQGNSAPAPPLL